MIVAVKRSSYKKMVIKVISFVALVTMFIAYYFHMSEKFAQEEQAKADLAQEQKLKQERSAAIENIIYNEAQIAVDLLNQEHVRNIKVIANRLYIVCDPQTNLDALMVRYGVMALVKTSVNDTKIAIDLKQIIESKYREE
ncbi:hypothetical protein [Candidatus Marinarcus aquaticus]|uniref:Uncharacterized protein n=1 Tax=Candidatus Marinarcus aquaticus TaxID=2044504 RepID=A0A4Q0XSC1_9BACT|nr:hypothetical protein [Candidatus Marinarcus aquaticus]RXJ56373.1 hypothetical protein CRV04_08125 [Candidatus Marinarcus aquaticus]